MSKYESWTSVDAVDRSPLDADIHYLHGELTNENVSETTPNGYLVLIGRKIKRNLNFI